MKLFILISFIAAYLMMVLPIDAGLRWWRPELIVILVVYWTMFEPHHFKLLGAWLAGLFQDLIEMGTLGIYAMSMLLVAYIIHLVYQRLRNYVLWHQAVWIFVLVFIFQLFSNWLNGLFTANVTASPKFLIASFVSCLFWPLLVILIERIKFYLRLSH